MIEVMDIPKEDYFFLPNTSDQCLCIIGIIASLHALYIEVRKDNDPSYKAACELGDNISFSNLLTSKYGRGFGFISHLLGNKHFMNVRNCQLGILFYSLKIIVGLLPSPLPVILLLLASIVSGSLYIAFIIFAVLKESLHEPLHLF